MQTLNDSGILISHNNQSSRYFDQRNGRLIYLNAANVGSDYWDKHWEIATGNNKIKAHQSPNGMVMRVTKRYLPEGSRILEGGCGMGQNVWGLKHLGYDVRGIDNAANTVALVNAISPDLNISLCDVRQLHFPTAYFDGYWSLGVIEHFWEGYIDIINEMARVIKPGGYLFLTFPAMNPARVTKSKKQGYPTWTNALEEQFHNRFYQFVLPVDEVEINLHKAGFRTIQCKFLDGYKGLKDEYPFVQQIFKLLSAIRLSVIVQKLINLILSCRYGHIAFFIMKREINTNA